MSTATTARTSVFTSARSRRAASALVAALVTLAAATPIMAQGYVFGVESSTYASLGSGRTVLWNGSLSPTDDGSADIPIGFTFDFQGAMHTTVRVSANGYLTFGGDSGSTWTNTDLPRSSASMNGLLCPWWDDLRVADLGVTDEVSYLLTGLPGTRTLTVQWRSVSLYGDVVGAYSFLNFQVHLRELGDRIQFDYGNYGVAGAPADSTATVGIEHPGGTTATVPVLGSPNLGIASWPGPDTRISFWRPAAGEFAGTLRAGTYSSLSATRTTLFLGSAGPFDDASTDIPIGFPFEFYGVPQTTLRVSTNGYATFPSESGTIWVNRPIPDPAAPNNLLAPWFDDLQIADLGGTTDEISWNYFGFLPGSRETIVEWRSVSRVTDQAGDYHFVNFQIHLFEDGNRIEFHYGSHGVLGAPTFDFSASCGLEDGSGTVGFAPFGSGSARTAAQFPPSGTIIAFEPAPDLLCGDCNGDMTVAITDALQAAQHGVGILTLGGANFLQCNVSGTLGGTGVIDVLDALGIARKSAGITMSLSCAP